ncbi:hypothetical protein R1sor_026720 [Riccia sorocarpa]|uniref:MYND-type domain-containing protein n=1 Tax=Riccia sorocarpa TaxID=122646 RepID=A0ABD3GC56_9MARC
MDVHLKELFGLFQEHFGRGPGLGAGSGTCLLKVEGISTAFIKSLYRTLALLWKSHPWKRLKASHLFGVKVGKSSDWPDARQPFTCVQFIGSGAGDLGLNILRSEEDAVGLNGGKGQGSSKSVPQRGMLRISFGPEVELSPANKKMIRNLGLEIAGPKAYPAMDVAFSQKAVADGFPSFRNPLLEELRWVYAALRALTQVHPQLEQITGVPFSYEDLSQVIEVTYPSEDLRDKSVMVRVSFPPNVERFDDSISSVPKLSESFDMHAERTEVPRQCVVCEKDVPAERAPRCSRCKAVIYCGHVCQKQDWNEVHKSVCELYKAMMERVDELEIKGFSFPYLAEQPCKWLEQVGLHGKGMWRRLCLCYRSCPFGQLPPPEGGGWAGAWGVEQGSYPPDAPLLDYDKASSQLLLSGWGEYYHLRGLPLSSPVAAVLSFPLTLYSIVTSICVSTKNMLAKGREVTIHYLGPEGELDWLPAFTEIGHLLTGSGSLHVVMVGPEVPSSLSGEVNSLGRKVRMTFVQGLYQEEANALQPPHLVVALNAGLDRHETWAGALEVIRQMGAPTFFTDYAEPCCVNAKQVLRASGLTISHPFTPNTFRSPVRNQIPSTNVPWFSNGFLFGVNP